MSDGFCEVRFDVPLPDGGGPRQFEKNWRAALAAQRLTALACAPARAVSARFRVFGPNAVAEPPSRWATYLPARLGALPGSPTVAAEPPAVSTDWQGIRIWLTYPARELTALLQKSKKPARK